MFYNVENFFASDPKPKHKLDPTPSGLRNWDEARYQNKLFKIGHVFELLKEQEGVLPMLCGLSEIQGAKVLDDLVALEIFEKKYAYVHYESMDERGVDVALLYDKTKIEIAHSETISFFFEIDEKDIVGPKDEEQYDTTRDILWCKINCGGEIANLFVLHLPSKRENDVNKPKRDYIIKELEKKILELNAEKKEATIIMGDFNENPDDENLKILVAEEPQKAVLNNPFKKLFEENVFSTFHQDEGMLFDQIILSEEFFAQNQLLRFAGATVFNNEGLRNWDRRFFGKPFRTYAGTRYLGGYSDHFPVYAVFEKS